MKILTRLKSTKKNSKIDFLIEISQLKSINEIDRFELSKKNLLCKSNNK